MIPIFHASGHYLYAKSAHLYLQNMLQLQEIMKDNESEYDEFVKNRGFTIKRSNKFRCGLFGDLVIETTLMR